MPSEPGEEVEKIISKKFHNISFAEDGGQDRYTGVDDSAVHVDVQPASVRCAVRGSCQTGAQWPVHYSCHVEHLFATGAVLV